MKASARRKIVAIAMIALCSFAALADQSRFTRVASEWTDPVYRQYDFWIGVGKANWRSKKADQFFHDDIGTLATHWVYPTLNGKALLEFAMSDDSIDDKGTRVQGFSVRYFDDRKARWVMAQEWPSPNQTTGITDQLQGFWRFGRINVFSTYYRGDPKVERTRRYTFSDIRPDGFIWHGAFSQDKGATWTAGTIVEFSKLKPNASWPLPGQPFPNYDNASHCTDALYRGFDNLAGEWHGTVRKNGAARAATMNGYLMLGGCAVMSILEYEDSDAPISVLEVRSPNHTSSDWYVYRLDSRRGTTHTYQIGNFVNGRISLHENSQYVIQGEFENLTPAQISRNDAESKSRTVWTALTPNSLAFEWWERSSPNADWDKVAEFTFSR